MAYEGYIFYLINLRNKENVGIYYFIHIVTGKNTQHKYKKSCLLFNIENARPLYLYQLTKSKQ